MRVALKLAAACCLLTLPASLDTPSDAARAPRTVVRSRTSYTGGPPKKAKDDVP